MSEHANQERIADTIAPPGPETLVRSDGNRDPSQRWGQIALLIFWIPLARVLGIWLSYSLAIGLSGFVVILIGYRFQSEQKKKGFTRWVCKALILSAGISGLGYVVSWLT